MQVKMDGWFYKQVRFFIKVTCSFLYPLKLYSWEVKLFYAFYSILCGESLAKSSCDGSACLSRLVFVDCVTDTVAICLSSTL